MISSSRGLVAPLLLLASLLLAQCGDLEKSLNNERDLYGAIALAKTPASTTSVYFSPNHASNDVKKRCSSLAEEDPTKPDRCDSASRAAKTALAQCASLNCEVVFEFKGTTESLVCASIASYNADTSYFKAARNASAVAAQEDALKACELKLDPDRDSLWCKKEGISFADCESRVWLKRFSAGAVDPIRAEVKCVVAGSVCLL
jgi:hypothetical protein